MIYILCFTVDGSRYPVWNREQGATEEKEWPTWCIYVAILLISVSILWIPGIALCRLFKIVIVEDSEPMLFPSDELREVHGIVSHEPTKFEQKIFGFREDGSEGMFWPTFATNPEEVLQEDE